jgi:hypothetical protein
MSVRWPGLGLLVFVPPGVAPPAGDRSNTLFFDHRGGTVAPVWRHQRHGRLLIGWRAARTFAPCDPRRTQSHRSPVNLLDAVQPTRSRPTAPGALSSNRVGAPPKPAARHPARAHWTRADRLKTGPAEWRAPRAPRDAARNADPPHPTPVCGLSSKPGESGPLLALWAAASSPPKTPS